MNAIDYSLQMSLAHDNNPFYKVKNRCPHFKSLVFMNVTLDLDENIRLKYRKVTKSSFLGDVVVQYVSK